MGVWGKVSGRGRLEGKGPLAGVCGWAEGTRGKLLRGWLGSHPSHGCGTMTRGGSEGLSNLPGGPQARIPNRAEDLP